jgi:lipoate synthase
MLYIGIVMKTQEQIEKASASEMKQWLQNAYVTFCMSGNHLKAAKNNLYVERYLREFERRGLDTPAYKQGFAAVFNGEGSW